MVEQGAATRSNRNIVAFVSRSIEFSSGATCKLSRFVRKFSLPHRNNNNCKLCNYVEHCKLSERYEISGNNIIGESYIAKFLEEL